MRARAPPMTVSASAATGVPPQRSISSSSPARRISMSSTAEDGSGDHLVIPPVRMGNFA